MQAVTAAPSHELLQRKDRTDTHSTRPTQRATAAALGTYSFGPMDMSNKSTGDDTDRKATKGLAGTAMLNNPLKSHSPAMVTTLQSVDNAKA